MAEIKTGALRRYLQSPCSRAWFDLGIVLRTYLLYLPTLFFFFISTTVPPHDCRRRQSGFRSTHRSYFSVFKSHRRGSQAHTFLSIHPYSELNTIFPALCISISVELFPRLLFRHTPMVFCLKGFEFRTDFVIPLDPVRDLVAAPRPRRSVCRFMSGPLVRIGLIAQQVSYIASRRKHAVIVHFRPVRFTRI